MTVTPNGDKAQITLNRINDGREFCKWGFRSQLVEYISPQAKQLGALQVAR